MPQEKFIAAASLQELREKEMLVVTGADRPVALIYHQDQVYAVDNRCPHLGFPLHRGTVNDGIINCHLHHARWELWRTV